MSETFTDLAQSAHQRAFSGAATDQTYADGSRVALEDAFQSAWGTLMAQARTHTTPEQHRQWCTDATRFINDRVAAIQWQADCYSGDPVRMDKLRTQVLFEVNPR